MDFDEEYTVIDYKEKESGELARLFGESRVAI